MWINRRLLIRATALVLTTTACGTPAAEPVETDPCIRRVALAASSINIDEQLERLDEALSICSNLDAFASALDAHPGTIGVNAAVFAARRCTRSDVAAVTTAPICDDAAVALLSSADSGSDSGSANNDMPTNYVGLNLDGEEVTIEPDADTEFSDDRPVAISQMVDLAFSDGCAGLRDEHSYWLELVDDPGIGPEASVYARHALDLMAFIGCEG
ncbi:MAG: hypothetical protein O2925_08205 [Actinomycetota bacterium]|nr:hypothetical protein [Actinomycetota bacterium]